MAGGGQTGTRAMADALRAVAVARVLGPPGSSARNEWSGLVGDLNAASVKYLSPVRGFGLGPASHADQEMAEGFRYVAHITKLALDVYLEDQPRFVRLVSPTLKSIGDNPVRLTC
jgi:hypothetical protein